MVRISSWPVRYGLAGLLTVAVLVGGASYMLSGHDLQTVAAERIVSSGPDRIAIKGYDPVGYFVEGRAIKGSPRYTHPWHDAVWQFASAEHRDLFAADPTRYAPQYGGYCSNAVLSNQAWDSNPEAWAIIDGKLYFSYDAESIERFERESAANVARANEIWQRALEVN
jgi:hypothetical protein